MCLVCVSVCVCVLGFTHTHTVYMCMYVRMRGFRKFSLLITLGGRAHARFRRFVSENALSSLNFWWGELYRNCPGGSRAAHKTDTKLIVIGGDKFLFLGYIWCWWRIRIDYVRMCVVRRLDCTLVRVCIDYWGGGLGCSSFDASFALPTCVFLCLEFANHVKNMYLSAMTV